MGLINYVLLDDCFQYSGNNLGHPWKNHINSLPFYCSYSSGSCMFLLNWRVKEDKVRNNHNLFFVKSHDS